MFSIYIPVNATDIKREERKCLHVAGQTRTA